MKAALRESGYPMWCKLERILVVLLYYNGVVSEFEFTRVESYGNRFLSGGY